MKATVSYLLMAKNVSIQSKKLWNKAISSIFINSSWENMI